MILRLVLEERRTVITVYRNGVRLAAQLINDEFVDIRKPLKLNFQLEFLFFLRSFSKHFV